ncbi:hypothetical protein EC511_06695 [Helicobacter pylori]|nr:hypothetical protein EC511_06695 [Helicobacter pylori]
MFWIRAIWHKLLRNSPIQKRNSPIRDFPKIPLMLFSLNLEKLPLDYNQALIFGLKNAVF